MELKLASMDLGQTLAKGQAKPQTTSIVIEDLANEMESKEGMQILYFDRSCKDKDLKKAKALIEAKGKTVYMGEVRYGLDSADMIYEFRII